MVIKAPEYQIIVSRDKHNDAAKWCEEKFGKRWSAIDNRSGSWCCFWTGFRKKNPGMYSFHFNNERDAVEFALRWA